MLSEVLAAELDVEEGIERATQFDGMKQAVQGWLCREFGHDPVSTGYCNLCEARLE